MLATGRAPRGNPRVILIGEPTEDLAPKAVAAVGEAIAGINRRGVCVLLVAQKLAIALKVSHRVRAMEAAASRSRARRPRPPRRSASWRNGSWRDGAPSAPVRAAGTARKASAGLTPDAAAAGRLRGHRMPPV